LIDLGVHVLDMVLWAMDDPPIATVSASTYGLLGTQGIGQWQGGRFRKDQSLSYEVEDLAVAYLRTTSGASIFVEASWASHSSDTDEFGIYLLGDSGGAELHVKDYATVDTLQFFTTKNGVQFDSRPRLRTKPPSAGHGEVISAFLTSILEGSPMSPNGRDGLARTELIDLIYRSAEEQRELNVASVPAESGVPV
jgi:predicted dehydrogenase